MDITTEQEKLAKDIQRQCHEYVNDLISRGVIKDRQAGVNSWFYLKLAELQLMLNKDQEVQASVATEDDSSKKLTNKK